MQSHEIRRHSDGSIDFDFYRVRAAAMRAQAFRNAVRREAKSNFTRIILTLIAGITVAASRTVNWF